MADTAEELCSFLDVVQSDRVWADRARAPAQAAMALRQWSCLRRRINGDLLKGVLGRGSLAALKCAPPRRASQIDCRSRQGALLLQIPR